ncbi:MAG: alpha/beta fold hydrolase [Blastochloris sp.]|nr:alpha/beta fold hydrolase [Blastochloris sp.]
MPKIPWLRLIRSLTFISVSTYLLVCGLLFFFQNRLLYPGAYFPLDLRLEDFQDPRFQVWKDGQGTFLGLKYIQPGAEANWVYFHGNGDQVQNLTWWHEILEKAFPERKWNLYLPEYPGFGLKEGRPDEESLTQASRHALNHLSQPTLPLYLVGQSLGSAVAVKMATDPSLKSEGLLLVTPFSSLSEAAQVFLERGFGPLHHFLPASLLLRDQWPNNSLLPSYQGRLWIISSDQDSITPSWMGRELLQLASEPKRFTEQSSSDHWVDWENLKPHETQWDFLWPQASP